MARLQMKQFYDQPQPNEESHSSSHLEKLVAMKNNLLAASTIDENYTLMESFNLTHSQFTALDIS